VLEEKLIGIIEQDVHHPILTMLYVKLIQFTECWMERGGQSIPWLYRSSNLTPLDFIPSDYTQSVVNGHTETAASSC